MFNDLNNPNSQSRPAVDDIFAETDKTVEGNVPGNSSNLTNSGIETRRVGLTATDGMVKGEPGKSLNNKWFKIILIVIVAAIIILSGYLVYSKFFKAGLNSANNLNSQNPESTNQPAISPSPVAPASNPDDSGTFVTPTSDTSTSTTVVPEIPGVNSPAGATVVPPINPSTATTSATTPAPSVDSDSDGLSDAEEKSAGSNINVIDTDNDGLSDYEEVKIYLTNPLSADTDGDSYLDGAEVKSGYDPNVKGGKLTKPVK